MAASKEWTDWHLCPGGWIRGTSRMDNGQVSKVATPDDRLLTDRRIEECNGYGPVHYRTERQWTSEDASEVLAAQSKFPPPY